MRVDVTASSAAIRKALGDISIYDAKSRLGLENAINKAVKRMAYRTRARVPRRRGALRRSIFMSFSRVKCAGEFGAKKPHAHLVERGTRGHWVKPNKKKALKIVDQHVRRFVRRAVYIPAIPARPFVEPAYKAEEPKLIDEIAKVMKEAH